MLNIGDFSWEAAVQGNRNLGRMLTKGLRPRCTLCTACAVICEHKNCKYIYIECEVNFHLEIYSLFNFHQATQ